MIKVKNCLGDLIEKDGKRGRVREGKIIEWEDGTVTAIEENRRGGDKYK